MDVPKSYRKLTGCLGTSTNCCCFRVQDLGFRCCPAGRKRDRRVDRSEGAVDGRKQKSRKRSLSNRQHRNTFADIMGDAGAPVSHRLPAWPGSGYTGHSPEIHEGGDSCW